MLRTLGQLRWAAIFATGLMLVSGALVIGGQWVPGIYWAVVGVFLLTAEGIARR